MEACEPLTPGVLPKCPGEQGKVQGAEKYLSLRVPLLWGLCFKGSEQKRRQQ